MDTRSLLIAYSDANPRVRPIAVKLLGSREYADRIPPSWPELSQVQIHVDGRAYSLPDAQGRYLEPEDIYPPPKETATAVATGNESVSAAAGITGEQFWDSVAATPSLAARERPRREAGPLSVGKWRNQYGFAGRSAHRKVPITCHQLSKRPARTSWRVSRSASPDNQ